MNRCADGIGRDDVEQDGLGIFSVRRRSSIVGQAAHRPTLGFRPNWD